MGAPTLLHSQITNEWSVNALHNSGYRVWPRETRPIIMVNATSYLFIHCMSNPTCSAQQCVLLYIALNGYSLRPSYSFILRTLVYIWYMRKDSKRKLMHSVSVCPCLSETVLAHTFCMCLHCFDMLSCPAKQMKTASSSSWGGSRMHFLK